MLPPQKISSGNKISKNPLEFKAAISANNLLTGKLWWGFSKSNLLACYQAYTAQVGKDTKELATIVQRRIAEELTSTLVCNLKIRTTFNGTGQRPWVHDVLTGHLPLHIPEHLLVINCLFGSIAGLGKVWSTLSKT